MNIHADPQNTYLIMEEMVVGPFSDGEVFQFVRSGKVSIHCLAYRPNILIAVPLSSIPELAYGLGDISADPKITAAPETFQSAENWTLISALSLILMAFVLVAALTTSLKDLRLSSENVDTVYKGIWKNRNDVMVGKAVDRYMQNTSWREMVAPSGEHFVEVSGEGMWRNKKVNIHIHFFVDQEDASFDLDTVMVNGFIQNHSEAESLLDVIINSYHPL